MMTDLGGKPFQIPGHLGELFDDERSIRDKYWTIKPDDVVLDIGCYFGTYAIPALMAGAAWVIAVDPFPEYTTTLQSLCDLNSVDTGCLTCVNEAVAGPEGYSEGFWAGLAKAQWQEIYARRTDRFTTLDELAWRVGVRQLDWVKIDVEGAELGVLYGGQETLTAFHPRLIIEDHTDVYPFVREMDSADKCLTLLAELGYEVETVRYIDKRGAHANRDFWICT